VDRTSSLAQRLMKRLRRRADEVNVGTGELPPVPSADELVQAMAAARRGRSEDCERFSLLLIAADRDGSVEVAAAAEALLADAEPQLWRNLDRAARRSWWHAPSWAEAARTRMAGGEVGPLGVVVASFHPSGFVREAAVARLGELDSVLVPPVLALRTGDWVPQVRDRARAAIEQHLASVDGLLAMGPVAVTLADRVHGRWLAERIEASMAAAPDADLARLRSAADWRVRRAAYSVALGGHRLGVDELLRAAKRDSDLVVRTRCALAAIAAVAATGDLDQVRPLMTSRTAAVRAEAVIALSRAGDTDTAVAALPDRNPLVREVAQAAVRRVGADPAHLYRDLVCVQSPPDPGAVAGLGETGAPADAELIRGALSHPRPRGRVEAVRALRRLAAADSDTMLAMLQDQAPAVARQAALSLRPQAGEVPVAALEPLISPSNLPHIRSATYRVLHEHDVWTRLRVDLELYDDTDDGLRNRAHGDLADWLSRDAATTYSMPSGHTADRLDQLLVSRADTLGRDRERLLRFHLGLTSPTRGS
jgi:hypothetical protein